MGDRLTQALADNLDAQAHNDQQTARLFNPTDEIDSAIERALELRNYPVPAGLVDALLNDLATIYNSNRQERFSEQASAGSISHILSGLGQRALGVKGFARAARPLLRDVAKSGGTALMAERELRRLIRENPEAARASSLANELGGTAHSRLTALLTEVAS